MKITDYTFKRSDDGELFVVIEGVDIWLVNEESWHSGDIIDRNTLLLSEMGFITLKAVYNQEKALLDAAEVIYEFHRNSHISDFGQRFLSPEQFMLLQAANLLTAGEIEYYEQCQARAARQKKKEGGRTAPTWIYLMTDDRTGYTKIGRSINPSTREKTLQSDNPLVQLIAQWEGARQDETVLHERFSAERIRGEWFDLDLNDIEWVRTYFREKN